MVLKVREVSGTIDRYFEQGDIDCGEVGLLRASFPSLGESLVGGMALRSKRAAVCAEPTTTTCSSTLSVSSLLSTSPAKATVTTVSPVCSRPISIVQQKKHNPYVTDKGHLVTWLDAMKAQSPPHFHFLHGDTPEAYDMEAAVYNAWREKHPSALSTFDKVMKEAKGKQVVMFLDYDGTLSPIVEDPDRAYMSEEMRATVKELATYFPTAIISGRARLKVYDFVQLPELYYAGSHGMDIMGPAKGANGFRANGTRVKDKKGNEVVLFQPASEYLPLMDKVCNILNESTKVIKGAKVEHNKFCVTVHFRRVKEEYKKICKKHGDVIFWLRCPPCDNMLSEVLSLSKQSPRPVSENRRWRHSAQYYKEWCEEEDGACFLGNPHPGVIPSLHFIVWRWSLSKTWGALAEKVESVLKDYPTLSLTHGRKVLEIRPAIAWDKGKAVDFLLRSLGFGDSNDVLPVYIGDDRTDEDAFKLLNSRKHGCSILVTSVPKATNATLSLQSPAEVMEFLRRLVRWKKRAAENRNGYGTQHGTYLYS